MASICHFFVILKLGDNMLESILHTSKYVVDNAKHVSINYDNIDKLISELDNYKSIHYLTNIGYDVYGMNTSDLVNFLLIYDAIDFSFWGNPKWTIKTIEKELDGGLALLHCIFNLFKNKDSKEVYRQLELMNLKEFSNILKGNVDIPLLEERYEILKDIVKVVNDNMNGSFYEFIKGLSDDKEIFDIIVNYFPSFCDERIYNGKIIYFYKLAQLLTSDILYVLENKDNIKVNRDNLVACADYKIPQVLNGYGILNYDENLINLLNDKKEIEVNSKYEVEIRASMIVVVDYIWEKTNRKISRIEINNFIWNKGQDRTIKYIPYHQTRTTNY